MSSILDLGIQKKKVWSSLRSSAERVALANDPVSVYTNQKRIITNTCVHVHESAVKNDSTRHAGLVSLTISVEIILLL